jgi:hypothetical protein
MEDGRRKDTSYLLRISFYSFDGLGSSSPLDSVPNRVKSQHLHDGSIPVFTICMYFWSCSSASGKEMNGTKGKAVLMIYIECYWLKYKMRCKGRFTSGPEDAKAVNAP